MSSATAAAVIALSASAQTAALSPDNPFAAESTLPFHAPDFARIHDGDYAPALDAGIAQKKQEVVAIANDPARPTFANTLIALEKTGQLLDRVQAVFSCVTGANTNPTLQKIRSEFAPKLAALSDSIYLNTALFTRVKTLYEDRAKLKLDPESLRLVEVTYRRFVQAGANLSEADKDKLKKLNEEESKLTDAFSQKLLAGTKSAAFVATDKSALSGLSDSEINAAAQAAKARNVEGYVLPLQNTTQQPAFTELTDRATRKTIFNNGWTRTERSDAADTRATIARLAQLRAEKAKLLGFPTYAAWKLQDQMAKTPEAVEKFLGELVPAATAKVKAESADIQAVIDAQNKPTFSLQPYDWEFYAEQVRKARYDLDQSQVKPYFEIDNVLRNGVFYAANQLYGITFIERHDLPVWQPDVRVFEVREESGKPLALFYCDYFKRDNKNGGAWMSSLVRQSKLMGTLPVVFNVANLPKPPAGQPALLSADDVITMFHEFGHALHGMFSNSEYPSLSGTSVSRDFVEFPSQFNEHWATYPAIFQHYAKHYQTGAPMPQELADKIKKSEGFNQGYALFELLAASQLDMQWHTLPAGQPVGDVDAFEKAALERTGMALNEVPPRYRSSYFLHIWANGYSAGYYAYQWAEMLDDDAYQWFEENGGLTRANGDRFRKMVLSRGNTVDLADLYKAWRGHEPHIDAMLKQRDLAK